MLKNIFTLTRGDKPAPLPESPPDTQAQAQTAAWIRAQAMQGPLVVEWGGAPWSTVVYLNGQSLNVMRLELVCDVAGNRNTLTVWVADMLRIEADFTAGGEDRNVGRTEIGITALTDLRIMDLYTREAIHAPV